MADHVDSSVKIAALVQDAARANLAVIREQSLRRQQMQSRRLLPARVRDFVGVSPPYSRVDALTSLIAANFPIPSDNKKDWMREPDEIMCRIPTVPSLLESQRVNNEIISYLIGCQRRCQIEAAQGNYLWRPYVHGRVNMTLAIEHNVRIYLCRRMMDFTPPRSALQAAE